MIPNRRSADLPQQEGKYMAGKFDLENYETVELRLRRLYTKFPEARVLTDLVFHDERRFIIKAEVYLSTDDLSPVATGYAEEIVGASPVNRTSALENGETSAIGRAISNSVLCLEAPVGARPSQQEMEKVERYAKEPRKPAQSKPARVYTDIELADVTAIMEIVKSSNSKDELRSIYADFAKRDLLEAPVNGTTLKDVFLVRVQELA
jgi:hypothetical protein